MKSNLIRIIALVLACLMVAVMAVGCSSGKKDDVKDENKTVDTGKAPEATKDDGGKTEPDATKDDGGNTVSTDGDGLYSLKNVVLCDDDNCLFRIDSIEYDDFWESAKFNVTCENKTDKQIGFSIGNMVLNGCMRSTLFLETADAGETVESYFNLDVAEDLLGEPQELIIGITVSDYEDIFADALVKDNVTVYMPGFDESNVKYPERKSVDGEKAVVDTDDYTVIVLGVDEDSWGVPGLKVYYENKTDRDVKFDIDDVEIGGKPVTSYAGSTVLAGCCGYENLSFDGDDDIEPTDYKFTVMVSEDSLWADPFFEQECTYEP